jgi:hypothetical protein
MDTDSNNRFYSENNDELIKDISTTKTEMFNKYLQPNFIVNTKHDIMFGSKNAYTPIRYHTNYRQFMCVNSGKIHVKMTPWKSRKYLHPIMDYANYEFRSPINAWDNTKNEKYMNDVDKLKYLEFEVNEGHVLHIPPYWWYSIKYSDSDTLLIGATYNSMINVLANIPDLGKYYIQQQNTTIKPVRTLISEENTEE